MRSAASDFVDRLTHYKQLIDEDIRDYSAQIAKSTRTQYGEYASLVTDMYLDFLGRGGKRLRGALTIVGYEMSGGQNRQMIVQAARAIEMLHAYILILDDMQDRSALRRGKPTAHKALAAYHRDKKWRGSAAHTGLSLAINAGLVGGHAAQAVLANLNVEPELRLKAISIINRTMVITAHGQVYDFVNGILPKPPAEYLDRVLEWKTALYSFINPLHVGMVLAGAECDATDAITPYATNLGKAFQITDDILGVFGSVAELGKSPMDDIREGKSTLLMRYTLRHASPDDRLFLKKCLGNPRFTRTEFVRAKQIIRDSSALEYAEKTAAGYVRKAHRSLEREKTRWEAKDVRFLQEMADHVLTRVA